MVHNNILVVGCGGREHAIISQLAHNHIKKVTTESVGHEVQFVETFTSPDINLYYCGSFENIGMSKVAQYYRVAGNYGDEDIERIRSICLLNKVDLVFVGGELPLQNGIVDELESINIQCIGPNSQLSQLECSKIYCRKLMMEDPILKQYCPKIVGYLDPTEKDWSKEEILQFVEKHMDEQQINQAVYKSDGLHGGKGVVVQGNDFQLNEAGVNYTFDTLQTGESMLIEQRLYGEEFSLMSFCDGYNFAHTLPVKDYKRLLNNDKGPNTGSMGSITGPNGQLWFLDESDIEECKQVNERVINLLQKKTGSLYRGVVYGSFMKTKQGIKVIEYNCRFGDPECINILHLMENNLLDLFQAIANGILNKINLTFKKEASIFKYIIPKGYPTNPTPNMPLWLPPTYANSPNVIFGSLVRNKDGDYKALTSRTLGIIETDKDMVAATNLVNGKLLEIVQHSYKLGGEFHFRRDIGLSLSLSYKQAGVNINEGNKSVNKIKQHVESTFNHHVASNFGDFNGAFNVAGEPYDLVSSCDGVGTKSILALQKLGKLEGLETCGASIVNHCVNDILVSGAEPLFFLDYFASSKINSDEVETFVKGCSQACREANCVLLGGETAEMTDVYQDGAYDLTGTIIGRVHKDRKINGKVDIKLNDVVVGLPSTGPHTNGYTLIRKIFERVEQISQVPDEIIKLSCNVHRSYLKEIQQLQANDIKINGLSHITGGGLIDNPPRVLPKDMIIEWRTESLDMDNLPQPFKYYKEKGHLQNDEMLRTFNCGIGMLIIVDPKYVKPVLEICKDGRVVGKVVASSS